MQVIEGLGLVKDLDKIIAAAAGQDRNGHIVKTHHAVSHFVQSSVAAAGIDPEFFPFLGRQFRRFAGNAYRLTGRGRHQDRVHGLSCLTYSVNQFAVLVSMVVAARRGVDDEQVLHIRVIS